MNTTSNTMTIAEFERLLDVYGSDRTRWPVEARASAGHLVARDRAARRLGVTFRYKLLFHQRFEFPDK